MHVDTTPLSPEPPLPDPRAPETPEPPLPDPPLRVLPALAPPGPFVIFEWHKNNKVARTTLILVQSVCKIMIK